MHLLNMNRVERHTDSVNSSLRRFVLERVTSVETGGYFVEFSFYQKNKYNNQYNENHASVAVIVLFAVLNFVYFFQDHSKQFIDILVGADTVFYCHGSAGASFVGGERRPQQQK